MPEQQVINMKGENVEKINLSDSVFGIKPNEPVMQLAIVCYLASQRRGTKSTLTRAEVSGGGIKPWKQKGTGRARQGSIRAPQWRHGGVVFAPKPRDFSFSINKKMRKLAMKSAFSYKFLNNEIVLLDDLNLESIKTKEICKILKNIGSEGKSCIILPEVNINVIKSANNIPNVKTVQVENLNTYNLIYFGKLIITKKTVERIEEVYA